LSRGIIPVGAEANVGRSWTSSLKRERGKFLNLSYWMERGGGKRWSKKKNSQKTRRGEEHSRVTDLNKKHRSKN